MLIWDLPHTYDFHQAYDEGDGIQSVRLRAIRIPADGDSLLRIVVCGRIADKEGHGFGRYIDINMDIDLDLDTDIKGTDN